MRRYGVHWPLFVAGYIAAALSLMGWLFVMVDTPWPRHTDSRGTGSLPPGFFAVSQVLVQLAIVYYLNREKAKQKEKATQAVESKPFLEPDNAAARTANPQEPLTRAWLQAVFGGLCAVVGGGTVVAHLLTDKVPVGAVIAYTIGVPLCVTLGFYLMAKAQQPANHVVAQDVSNTQPEGQTHVAPVTTVPPVQDTLPSATLRR